MIDHSFKKIIFGRISGEGVSKRRVLDYFWRWTATHL